MRCQRQCYLLFFPVGRLRQRRVAQAREITQWEARGVKAGWVGSLVGAVTLGWAARIQLRAAQAEPFALAHNSNLLPLVGSKVYNSSPRSTRNKQRYK